MVVVVEGVQALYAVSVMIGGKGWKIFREGCRRQVPYDPEGMVHCGLLRHRPLSTPTLGAPLESGT